MANLIHPTYEALSEESLLSSCIHEGTQYQSEAISTLIWQHANKETRTSVPTV